MHDNKALCDKIREIFPDTGECGIDVSVEYDEPQKAYLVSLKKGVHQLSTHLETADADMCMSGKQCVGLGLQISQLKSNVETA